LIRGSAGEITAPAKHQGLIDRLFKDRRLNNFPKS
jgi:hypothetical protein